MEWVQGNVVRDAVLRVMGERRFMSSDVTLRLAFVTQRVLPRYGERVSNSETSLN